MRSEKLAGIESTAAAITAAIVPGIAAAVVPAIAAAVVPTVTTAIVAALLCAPSPAAAVTPKPSTQVQMTPHEAHVSTPPKAPHHTRTRPRFDHSFNASRTGVNAALRHFSPKIPINIPQVQKLKIDGPRTSHEMKNMMLVGHDHAPVTAHNQTHSKHIKNHGGTEGPAGNDNGGADTSSSDPGQKLVNQGTITAEQAREFGKIVKTNFDNWDIERDGKLTLKEIYATLRDPNYKGKESAALAALALALKTPGATAATASGTNRYYTLKSLYKLAKNAENAHESALLRLFTWNASQLKDDGTIAEATRAAIENSVATAVLPEKQIAGDLTDDENANKAILARFQAPPVADTEAAAAEIADLFAKKTNALGGRNNPIDTATLDQGSMLVAHDTAVSVTAGNTTITVAPKAVAYILHMGDEVVVYNLSDLKHGDVRVQVGGQEFRVPVGQQVLATQNQKAEFKQVNPFKEITAQNDTKLATVGNTDLYRAEFSPTAALDNIAQFQLLIDSDSKADRLIAERIIKTAAIILTLNSAN